ncbi:MAG: SDR family NAD(P)-dependent oxidoreductase [Candidatus Lokiarchaeota archaeon]
MFNIKYLKGTNTLITGGGRGIGRAIALEFAKNGANVAIVALEKYEVENTIKEIINEGVSALGIDTDLSQIKNIKKITSQFFKKFDHCDCLVNNVGISHYSAMIDYPLDKAIKLFQVNFISYYAIIKEFLPNMIRNKKGKIIMTSSVQGNMFFNPMKVAYSASKAAITAMSRCLDAELREYNIQVNTILPGAVDTRLVKINAEKGQITPDPKPPSAISPFYLFLASKLSEKKYSGKIINEYLISQILSKIEEITSPYDFKMSYLKEILKKKLTKGQYSIFRKNQELIEFLLKYQR